MAEVVHEQWVRRRRWVRVLWAAAIVAAVVGGAALWGAMRTEQCVQHDVLGTWDEPSYDPRLLAERLGTDLDGANGPSGLRDQPGTYRWTDGFTSWELTVERGGATGTRWQFGAPRECRQV